MFDIKIRRGDGSLEYTLITTRKTHIVNKEVTHNGMITGVNRDQDAVIVDTGRAHDVIKLAGDSYRTAKTIVYNEVNAVFPGEEELEDAFKNWWKSNTGSASGVGMPILKEGSTYWEGYFGDCKITEKADSPESIEFDIEFNIVRSINNPELVGVSAGVSYIVFQYLDSTSNTYVDDRAIISQSITDSLTSHIKTGRVRLADTTGAKYAAYTTGLTLENANIYKQGQLVRFIHDLSGQIVLAGRIERIEPGDENGERYVELLIKDHLQELLVIRTSALSIPLNPNFVNFASQSLNHAHAIYNLAEAFKVGGAFNNSTGTVSINTSYAPDSSIWDSAVLTRRDFTGANIPVLDAMEILAETIVDSSVTTPQGCNFFLLSVNGNVSDHSANSIINLLQLRKRFSFPANPLADGLTLVYGEQIGDGSASTGVYKMPIISLGMPNTVDDVYNDIAVYGRKVVSDEEGAESQITGVALHEASQQMFGKRTRFIHDPTITTAEEATARAAVEISKTDKPVTRALVTTFGYPMFRRAPYNAFEMVNVGDLVHVRYPIYGIDTAFEVAEIFYNGASNTSDLELIKPGSGYPSKWSLEKRIVDLYKQTDMIGFAARGPGVGLSVSAPAEEQGGAADAAALDTLVLMKPIAGWPRDLNVYRGFGGADNHNGIDYAISLNTPVYSAVAGYISEMYFSPDAIGSRGIFVGVSFDLPSASGLTRYLHLNSIIPGLTIGVTVVRGQLIGYSGNTGSSTGPHLHFDLEVNNPGGRTIIYSEDGRPKIDPQEFITLEHVTP